MARRIMDWLFAASFALAAASAQDVDSLRVQLEQAQGEYVGMLRVPAGDEGGAPAGAPAAAPAVAYGAQLIARIDSQGKAGQAAKLRCVLYRGGLPGAGAQRDDRVGETGAAFTAKGAEFAFGSWALVLAGGDLRVTSKDGESLGRLQRVVRKSSTLGAKPPQGATVLFDGSSAEGFHGGRLRDDSTLAVGCDSRQRFADHRLHLEFRTPFQPARRGQGRGNSGVYLQGRYECQVLDSFGLLGENNECGGVYSVAAPILNACLPPGQWQTYDIEFTAARWRGLKKVRNARATVHLNGILVHDDVELPRVTAAAKRKESDSAGGLYLQDHGNPVSYRNIWVQQRDPDRRRRVVFLAGAQSHGYGAHEHRAGCKLLAKALAASDLALDVEVHDLWPADPSALRDADAIVVFADGGGRHPMLRHLDEVEAEMQRGASLVCLHYAVEVPSGNVGVRFRNWLGGGFETHWSVNPIWTADFVALPDHPVTRGVEPFALRDEWYFHMRFRPGMEGVTPILSAVAPAATMSRKDGPHSGNPAVRRAVAAGEPQHVAWAYKRADGGRSFGFTGGHVHWNWAQDDVRKLVLNAIVWAAGIEVPAAGVASATPDLAALQEHMGAVPKRGFARERVQQLLDAMAR
ncbi:MAG: family 16 glycoside hydrolase [Planctomycetota bacterium]